LLVARENAQVKIEPNLVVRGTVFPPESRDLCDAVQQEFELVASASCLSVPDLYAGKICAALDRQNPRDLYDVMLLLEDEGITPEIRRAFVVYLASHSRPMSELLDPTPEDARHEFEQRLSGMVRSDVSFDQLRDVQERLPRLLRDALDEDETRFILSVKAGDPDWGALGIDHLHTLPAVQWKLRNIRAMSPGRRREALDKLRHVLER
jgi:predicted nucleotidyltransferase component of viral defense system